MHAIIALNVVFGSLKSQFKMKKDRINDRILHELKRSGRIANAELADKVGLSPSACLRRVQELEKLGTELDLKKVALTFVPSFSDKTSEVYLNKINPKFSNTFLLYKRSNIFDKYVDLKPTQENFKIITERLDKSANEYFKLSKPKRK